MVRRVVLIALLSMSASCSDDDSSDGQDPPGQTESSVSFETVPSTAGRVEVAVGEVTYTADIPNCVLDSDQDLVDFTGTGTHDGEPIRIEYGQATAGRLAVFIGVANPLDPGSVSYIGDPTFSVTDHEAQADGFRMINTTTSAEADARVAVECGL